MSNNKKRKDRGAQLEQDLLRLAAKNDLDETLASIRNLVEIQRVNVNCADENGKTPLILAVLNDHVPVARFLIGKEATVAVDAVDNDGRTALVHAMRRNNPNIEMLRLLLKSGADKDQQFQAFGYAYSPLGFAIEEGNVDMVELLLRFRANTVETLCFGYTFPALHQACRYSSAEIVGLLLDHEDGVDLNKQIRWCGRLMTPLCFACRDNNMEIVQLLVEREAQVFYDGVGRDTPLDWALIGGSMELIRFLMGKLPQGDNSAALSWPLKTALSLNKLEAAQLLLQNGANVNGQPYLYMCAASWHGEEGVEDRESFLLENGADVNMKNKFGETPLHAAAEHGGNVELVKMFLKAGAHVSMTNNFGKTPLFAAAEGGSVEVVKMLLKVRADVNIRTNLGETPLGVAYRKGHVDVVYLLLRTSPQVWPRLANFV